MRTNSSGLILLESIFRLILEGRKEDAVSKNPNLTNEIEILSFNDPTGNLKFLPWQIKMLKLGVSINNIQRFSSLFFKFANRLAKDGKSSDINYFQANMFDDTLQSLESYESETKEKEKQLKDAKTGSEIIFESDYFIVRAIKNKAAAIHYGRNTKWCITQADANHYENYAKKGIKMFYVFATQQKDLGGDPNLGKIAIAINDVYQDEMEIFDAADNALTVYEAESFVGKDWQSIIQTIHLTLQDDQQLSPLDSVFKIVATTNQILDVLSTEINHVVDKAFLKKVAYAILDNTKDAEVSETLIEKMLNRNPLAFLRNDDRFLEKFITNAQFSRNVFGQIFDIIIGLDDEQLVNLLFWKQKAFVTNRVRDLMFFKLVNEQEIHDGFVEYVTLSPDQFIKMAKILAEVNVEQLVLLARRKDIDETVVNKIVELLFLNYKSDDAEWRLVFSTLSKRNALSTEQIQFFDDFFK